MLSLASATFAALFDLVLPVRCAGCAQPGGTRGVCDQCAEALAEPVRETRPTPAPPGLPPCRAGGEYAGGLRELILAYKEHGRRDLARPLGDALARVVAEDLPASSGPVALVPVPGTAAAIRARHGDHMLRLAQQVAARLDRAGRRVQVVGALRALPRPDSAGLDRAARALAARSAFVVRASRVHPLRAFADAGLVVLLDDVLTTGATLAAVAGRLLEAGVPVAFAATLAATRLRLAGVPGGAL